jgi:hypothetical protein
MAFIDYGLGIEKRLTICLHRAESIIEQQDGELGLPKGGWT